MRTIPRIGYVIMHYDGRDIDDNDCETAHELDVIVVDVVIGIMDTRHACDRRRSIQGL